jgi:hypothetical protein
MLVDMFGFLHENVKKSIQELPNAQKFKKPAPVDLNEEYVCF